jgi:hypothetical protein
MSRLPADYLMSKAASRGQHQLSEAVVGLPSLSPSSRERPGDYRSGFSISTASGHFTFPQKQPYFPRDDFTFVVGRNHVVRIVQINRTQERGAYVRADKSHVVGIRGFIVDGVEVRQSFFISRTKPTRSWPASTLCGAPAGKWWKGQPR